MLWNATALKQLSGLAHLILTGDAKEIKLSFTDRATFFFVMNSSAGTRKNQLLAYQPVTALGQGRDVKKS